MSMLIKTQQEPCTVFLKTPCRFVPLLSIQLQPVQAHLFKVEIKDFWRLSLMVAKTLLCHCVSFYFSFNYGSNLVFIDFFHLIKCYPPFVRRLGYLMCSIAAFEFSIAKPLKLRLLLKIVLLSSCKSLCRTYLSSSSLKMISNWFHIALMQGSTFSRCLAFIFQQDFSLNSYCSFLMQEIGWWILSLLTKYYEILLHGQDENFLRTQILSKHASILLSS